MATPRCSKCDKELMLDSVSSSSGSYSGGPVVMAGGDMISMMRKTLDHPRACTSCQKNWCTACAIKAGEENGTAYYACPQCGIGLGEYRDKPILISNPNEMRELEKKGQEATTQKPIKADAESSNESVAAKVRLLLEQSQMMFVEARRGRVSSNDSADSYSPYLTNLPNYPLPREPNRREQILEADAEASRTNDEYDSLWMKYESTKKLFRCSLLISLVAVLVAIAMTIARAISPGILSWLLVLLALTLALVSLTVAVAVWSRHRSLWQTRIPYHKPRFFSGQDSLNDRCPACATRLTTNSDLREAEEDGYRSANQMLLLSNQATVAFGSIPFSDLDAKLRKTAFSELDNAAHRVAKLAYYLGYHCTNCKLRFCSACTGGPDIPERVCPDCNSRLAAEE